VQPVGIHHLPWTVIGKYLEDVIAAAMEMLERSSAVTLGNGVPRLDVSIATFRYRYAKPLGIPLDEIFLRPRWPRD
jgi:hypothetical protein